MVGNLQNIFMDSRFLLNILMIFGIKYKFIIDAYNAFLAVNYDWLCGPGLHMYI